MKTFVFWYTETSTYKASFEAESLESAEAMLEAVQNGGVDMAELPEFYEKYKDGSYDIAFDTFEEI
jgi:hypothetical protein